MEMGPYGAFRKLLFALPPEFAHQLALTALRTGLFADRQPDDPILAIALWDRKLRNPIGLAAGFDKDARCLSALSALGFGLVEVGGVTPRPQPGNPRPRVFRDQQARAIINRFGLNSQGLEVVAPRLRAHRDGFGTGGPPIAVNLGPNADSSNPVSDYAELASELALVADLLVINVSSPNTTGLRDLQAVSRLSEIFDAIEKALPESPKPKLLVKLTSDLPPETLEEVADFAINRPLDGLTISNTTIKRPLGIAPGFAAEKGGLSGSPLKPLALEALRRVASVTQGRIPLVGVGGIESGEDAYRRIRAGASVLQLYTALVFDGPRLIGTIKRDLANRLRADGATSIADVVGADIS